MKNLCLLFISFMVALLIFSGCSKKSYEVECTLCNGSGEVKYYYGDGDSDYRMGPCTSCDEKGYITVTPSNKPTSDKQVICGSCGEFVEKIITKKDVGGDISKWCEDCWDSYYDILGK